MNPIANRDHSQTLQQQIKDAIESKTPLRIVGGNSKAFYANRVQGDDIHLHPHSGIVSYEPTELVITARAGTPLKEIEQTLAEQGQFLAFESPHFGERATLGGTIACGFSGPRRPYTGSARDFVLGTKVLSGKGDILNFGGQVMKNVAGYDVSRMMTGSLGTLGILLDISLKVLPIPAEEITLVQEMDADSAIKRMNEYADQPLPLSAACYHDEKLWLRLSGAKTAVEAARQKLGGEQQDNAFWQQLREHQLDFFKQDSKPLWRLSVASDTPAQDIPGEALIDWGGAQYWLRSDQAAEVIRNWADKAGGHATLFRDETGNKSEDVFHPLSAPLKKLHLNLKTAFDPYGLLNYGRMYSDI